MPLWSGSEHSVTRVLAEAVVTLVGIIILAWAATIGKAWVDTHFLPDYFHPRPRLHDVVLAIRIIAAVGGVAVIVYLRPYVGRVVMAGRGRALFGSTLSVLVAIALALLVSERVLRTSTWRARHEAPPLREPIQRPHPRLGWVLVSNHVGTRFIGGRTIEYALDESGYRVRCVRCSVATDQPSILFTGESIMLGTGLHWSESVPALVESRLRVQSVNLAVNGYANDQAYMRLATELPRFTRPVAVVSFFMPSLLSRNLKRDRPHLDPFLQWRPAQIPWRLRALADRLLKYDSTTDIEAGIATTRAVLQATVQLARSRGAVALVLVPRFPPESLRERELRRRILDEGGIDYVLVDLKRSWRFPDDKHPNARSAQAMAAAVAERLRARLRAMGVDG